MWWRRSRSCVFVGVHVGSLPDPPRPVLFERVRRECDVQLHRGVHEPIRIGRRRPVGADRGRSTSRSCSRLIAICGRSASAPESRWIRVRDLHGRTRRRSLSRLCVVFRSQDGVSSLSWQLRRIIALFLISGAATRYPMTSLPRRPSVTADARSRSPAALTAALGFAAVAALAIVFFPSQPIFRVGSGAPPPRGSRRSDAPRPRSGPTAPPPAGASSNSRSILSRQPRVPCWSRAWRPRQW